MPSANTRRSPRSSAPSPFASATRATARAATTSGSFRRGRAIGMGPPSGRAKASHAAVVNERWMRADSAWKNRGGHAPEPRAFGRWTDGGLQGLVGEMFPVSPEKARALAARMEALGVREADLEEHFIRARGHGGQNVNKVSTCVVLR